jgi:ABC-2 type transport system permease protein
MKKLLRQIGVIARRDFLAIVGTPTFILFLIAPLFMFAMAAIGGTGAAQLGASSAKAARIFAIANDADGARIKIADTSLRALYRGGEGPPELIVVAPKGDPVAQERALYANPDNDVRAVMRGPLTAPVVSFNPPSDRYAAYLARLAETVVRSDRSGVAIDATLVKPVITANTVATTSKGAQQASGFGAVFGIFFLTLLLAGQTVGTLAEEKGNKVIEILAASVRLEAVFLGKLIGMFGVAVVFIAFWGLLAALGLSLLPKGAALGSFAPAIGLPTFLVLCALYFTMSYMLLGAVFLGVGAQATAVREIQMLSLPITIFMVGMFGVASAGSANPGSRIAYFAEIFPFSSPFAMAARGATDPSLWPHILALAWQALWVGITISIAVRMFRIGVLKSGNGWRGLFKRTA